MKKYIVKTIKLAFPILFLAIPFEVLLRIIPNDYKLKKEYLDISANRIEVLILGNSHSFYGIDPNYFSCYTFNVGNISQSLDLDFEILKKYGNNFKKLHTIILPVSYFSLFETLEQAPDSWRVKNYVLYYRLHSIGSFKDCFEILSNRLNINLRRLKLYYIDKKPNISCSQTGWGLGFAPDNSKDLKITGENAAKRHTVKDFTQFNELTNILQQIIDFSKKRNIKVILYTPPAFESYRQNLHPEQIEKTIMIVEKISNERKNCIYLNMLNSPYFNQSDFYDGDHLNELGAKKLSILLNEKVNHLNSINSKLN